MHVKFKRTKCHGHRNLGSCDSNLSQMIANYFGDNRKRALWRYKTFISRNKRTQNSILYEGTLRINKKRTVDLTPRLKG